jgi:hypothetical protein
MLEGEQPEEMLKSLGETVMLPNCAVVSPEFWIFKLKVNVEPCSTVVDEGLTVAEREGGKIISNELEVAVVGEPVVLILAEIVFPEDFVFATTVVQLILVVPELKYFVVPSLVEKVVLS